MGPVFNGFTVFKHQYPVNKFADPQPVRNNKGKIGRDNRGQHKTSGLSLPCSSSALMNRKCEKLLSCLGKWIYNKQG